ncbi:thermonuclease family protein [Candidatus Gracilibacteria bacterium]|nr:thermonuclease family protein [Candidatus Gracilibacteria bacterium]
MEKFEKKFENKEKKQDFEIENVKNNLRLKIFAINAILIFGAFAVILLGNDKIGDFEKNENLKIEKQISKIDEKNIFVKNVKKSDEKEISGTENISEKQEFLKNISQISDKISYKVYKVLDGDTIKVFNENGEKKSVRMIGLDTPESYKIRFGYKECFGDEASNYLKKLVGNSEFVQIELDKTQGNNGIDRYGRILGYVFLNGENLNGKMIKDGFGWEYTYKKNFYKYQKEFRQNEDFARENNLGLWAKDTCDGKRMKAK